MVVEGEESELCEVLSGVPQGSVLKPLMFYCTLMTYTSDAVRRVGCLPMMRYPII